MYHCGQWEIQSKDWDISFVSVVVSVFCFLSVLIKGLDVWMKGLHVWIEGLNVWFEGLDVWSEGLHVSFEGLDVWRLSQVTSPSGVYWPLTDHLLTTYRPPTNHFFMVQLVHNYTTSVYPRIWRYKYGDMRTHYNGKDIMLTQPLN